LHLCSPWRTLTVIWRQSVATSSLTLPSSLICYHLFSSMLYRTQPSLNLVATLLRLSCLHILLSQTTWPHCSPIGTLGAVEVRIPAPAPLPTLSLRVPASCRISLHRVPASPNYRQHRRRSYAGSSATVGIYSTDSCAQRQRLGHDDVTYSSPGIWRSPRISSGFAIALSLLAAQYIGRLYRVRRAFSNMGAIHPLPVEAST